MGCHGAAEMSGLDLRQRESILKGGKRGSAVVPGNPDQSLLYQAVAGNGELKMPPGKGRRSPRRKSRICAWIRDGARSDSEVAKTAEPSWWSFRKAAPSHGSDGEERTAWVRNPIDAFVLANARRKGPEARGAGCDKTHAGAPRLFRCDRPAADAGGDRCVSSATPPPTLIRSWSTSCWRRRAYGETWGRHWLDVVRYADSGGFETDIYFPNAWRYRDYVIQSLQRRQAVRPVRAGADRRRRTVAGHLELEGSYYIPQEKRSIWKRASAPGCTRWDRYFTNPLWTASSSATNGWRMRWM